MFEENYDLIKEIDIISKINAIDDKINMLLIIVCIYLVHRILRRIVRAIEAFFKNRKIKQQRKRMEIYKSVKKQIEEEEQGAK